MKLLTPKRPLYHGGPMQAITKGLEVLRYDPNGERHRVVQVLHSRRFHWPTWSPRYQNPASKREWLPPMTAKYLRLIGMSNLKSSRMRCGEGS